LLHSLDIPIKYYIENEHFIVCSSLPADRFISYCKKRAIPTSRHQLERYEKLGIFHPLFRVRFPKIKNKVEYIDDGARYHRLGKLEDNEEWSGDVLEEYADFFMEKDYALSWLEEGYLWEPSGSRFIPSGDFIDEDGARKMESYYSRFQCYHLYELIKQTKFTIHAEWWSEYDKEKRFEVSEKILEWSRSTIDCFQSSGMPHKAMAELCQVLSNRYYPHTQSDGRSIRVSQSGFIEWDWDQYRKSWDAEKVLDELGTSRDEIKKLQKFISAQVDYLDPISAWHELVSFISVEKKERLKREALLAQTMYAMEKMIRLFYFDLTGERLKSPEEREFPKVRQTFFGTEGVIENMDAFEILLNQYHLNPRPRLILIVEGEGEQEQFHRIIRDFYGYKLITLGIEIRCLQGIGNFEGMKPWDKYGALEKFIDYHHSKQTIVYIVLDNERRAKIIREKLIKREAQGPRKRTVTKKEYIHLWEKNIEFDNFSNTEISLAMTRVSESRKVIKEEEIQKSRDAFNKSKDINLMALYKEKCNYGLNKRRLLEELVNYIIDNPDNEVDQKKNLKRGMMRVIWNVIELSQRNRPPQDLEIKDVVQKSDLLGDVID